MLRTSVYLEDSTEKFGKLWFGPSWRGPYCNTFQIWVCGLRPTSEEGVCPHVSPANVFLLQHVRTSWVIWGTHRVWEMLLISVKKCVSKKENGIFIKCLRARPSECWPSWMRWEAVLLEGKLDTAPVSSCWCPGKETNPPPSQTSSFHEGFYVFGCHAWKTSSHLL